MFDTTPPANVLLSATTRSNSGVRKFYPQRQSGTVTVSFLQLLELTPGDSLQINIGIIAACAPTLRPLVSNVLHLSTNSASRYPSNNVYGPNRSGATRGTGILGVRSLNNNDWVQTESFNGDFELEDRLKRQHDGNQPQTNAAAEGSGFGSEEMIIPSKDNDGGIMRTTVVTAT